MDEQPADSDIPPEDDGKAAAEEAQARYRAAHGQ